MFKTLSKSPFLLLAITMFALVGCGDQSQSSAEQAVDEAADQVEETATEEVEETTTQD